MRINICCNRHFDALSHFGDLLGWRPPALARGGRPIFPIKTKRTGVSIRQCPSCGTAAYSPHPPDEPHLPCPPVIGSQISPLIGPSKIACPALAARKGRGRQRNASLPPQLAPKTAFRPCISKLNIPVPRLRKLSTFDVHRCMIGVCVV